jgi:hypothetical protein
LEGRVQDFGDRFDALDRRMESFERRLDSLERRMDARFELVDRRFVVLEGRLHGLDDKMSKQFRWLVAGQVAVLISVIGTLSAALFLR